MIDDGSEDATEAERTEMFVMVAGNLATHFGMIVSKASDEYQAGDLADVDGAGYVGTDYTTDVPDALVDDVLQGDTDILWIGENAEALAVPGTQEQIIANYGWDPTQYDTVESNKVEQLLYNGTMLDRLDG